MDRTHPMAREAEALIDRMGMLCLKREGAFAVALAPRDPAGPVELNPRRHADPAASVRAADGPAEVLPDWPSVLAAGWRID